MPIPTDIKFLQKTRMLEISFDNGQRFSLPSAYLRSFSPSAETRHRKPSDLASEKAEVNIIGIKPIGNYAIKLEFDDGHCTGIYSWDTLYDLSIRYVSDWKDQLKKDL